MNNIFNYATKELSQDAFISWIISNYDNELKNISLDFLNFLTNSYLINKIIKNIKIDKQQNKIDVLVQIELCSDEKIILVIEDKIYSNEHDNQLKRYEEKIKNCFSCSKTFYVFYKTSYVFKEDKENIEKKGWGVFDIFRINDFWKKYISSSNLIIKMYSRFIKQKTDDLNTTSLPICYNHTKWEGFFRNYIEERVKKERKQLITWSFITRYRYACFGARGKTKKEGFPYLEIRDRDCFNNKFKALILRYHPENVKIDEEEEFKKLKECIKKVEGKYREKGKVFSLQGTIKKNKQIAKFFCNDVKNREEFLRLTLIAIDRYLEIVNEYVMDEIL